MEIAVKRLAAVLAVTVALVLSGCGENSKYTERYKDADRSSTKNTEPAEVGTMPDGFSNYATKCDRPGIRVYVLFHEDSPYGDIAVIADENCK